MNMPKAIRNPTNAIIDALSTHDKLTWAELLKLTHLSKGALSEYINQMIKDNQIKTEVDGSSRPPKTLYSLVDPVSNVENPFFNDQFEDKNPLEDAFTEIREIIPAFTSFSIHVGNALSKLEDRQKAQRLLDDYLKWASDFLISYILYAICFTSVTPEGHAVVNRIKSEKQPHPQVKHEEILELWVKYFKQFDVSSMVESLFIAVLKNPDIAFDEECPVVLSLMLQKKWQVAETEIGRYMKEEVASKEKEAEKDSSSTQ